VGETSRSGSAIANANLDAGETSRSGSAIANANSVGIVAHQGLTATTTSSTNVNKSTTNPKTSNCLAPD
jgi:hypothetical protein